MIKFENVTKDYGNGTVAVNAINFDIRQGEFFVIIGPSGCGKTTTLKMINRLISLSDGTLFIDGKKISEYNIHELRWNIGYVLQQIALFPHLSIEENITIVPEMKKWSKEEMKKRAYELMEMVGLDPEVYADRKPNQLSGGEQQRIGVIRALAADPEIILMDEPFSALDPISREKLQDDLLEIKERLQKTTVFVTHDVSEALKLADRICIMKEGEIVQVGTPQELMNQPVNTFVKQFIGSKGESQDDFNLKDILLPMEDTDMPGSANTIAVSTPLNEVMENLSEHERLIVEQEGKPIGMINRQALIQYLAEGLQESGVAHE